MEKKKLTLKDVELAHKMYITAGDGAAKRELQEVFARTYDGNVGKDTVIIAVYQEGSVEIPVKGYFKNNVTVRNAYTGETAIVKGGKVTFNAGNQGLILLEEVK